MMPYMYPPPSPSSIFPMLIVTNRTHVEGDEDDYVNEMENSYSSLMGSRTMPIPMTAQSPFVSVNGQISSPTSISNNEQGTFRLRMNVEGFQPNDLNISIRNGRLIVRGKHITHAPVSSSIGSSINNGDDDNEPDFVAKEFKRTFDIPPNLDTRTAHAQYYPQQQLLVVEIPLENSTTSSSQTRSNRLRLRPIDIFLTIITILFMDRALRITYYQFMINENRLSITSSQNTN